MSPSRRPSRRSPGSTTPTGPIDLLVVTPGRVESSGGTGPAREVHADGRRRHLRRRRTRPTRPHPSSARSMCRTDGRTTFRVVADADQSRRRGRPIQHRAHAPADRGPRRVRHRAALDTHRAAVADHRLRRRRPPGAGLGGERADLGRRHAGSFRPSTPPATSRSRRRAATSRPPAPSRPRSATRATRLHSPPATVCCATVVVEDGTAGEQLTGTVTEGRRPKRVAAAVRRPPCRSVTDGTARTRAVIDQVFDTPGSYIATLQVCRGAGVLDSDLRRHRRRRNNAVPAATVVHRAPTRRRSRSTSTLPARRRRPPTLTATRRR